jgi:hypothetical protein
MDDREEKAFRDEHGALVAALRARRGPCPPVERLLEREGEAVAHAELCADCAELLARLGDDAPPDDDVAWQRAARNLDGRAAPWKTTSRPSALSSATWRRWAIAAVVILAAGGVARWRIDRRAGVPPAVSETRGDAIQIEAPSGAVASMERFSWSVAMPMSLRYRVSLRRGDTVVWQGESTTTSLDLPPAVRETLTPGAYSWRVEGLDQDRRVAAASPWSDLTLSARR